MLLTQIIDPLMDQKLKGLSHKLDEILKSYQTRHSITYNHYLTETIQKVKKKCHKEEIAHRLQEFLDHKNNMVCQSEKH